MEEDEINEMDELEDLDEDIVTEDAFWHIEASLINGFEPNMKLEIVYDEGYYWIASVINVISSLLSLRWEGANNNFWFDIKHKRCYPYGHFYRNQGSYQLVPPPSINLSENVAKNIKDNYMNIKHDQMQNDNKPDSLYSLGGLSQSNLFRPSTMLEISHNSNPEKHWFAQVINNVGGRLYVKWYQRNVNTNDDNNNDDKFWIFYCHPRVHHLGYAHEKGNIAYEPTFFYDSWVSDIDLFLSEKDKEITKSIKCLLEFSKSRRPDLIESSAFKTLGVSDIASTFSSDVLLVTPIAVKNIYEDHIIFSNLSNNSIACYPNDDNFPILPLSWSCENGISTNNSDEINNLLSQNKPFSRADIRLLPSERIKKFKTNHKVEIVHPKNPSKICEGIVTRITHPLVWVEISPDIVHVLPYNSTELFPFGFCEDNHYKLTRLLESTKGKKNLEIVEKNNNHTNDNINNMPKVSIPNGLLPTGAKVWCPRIYFNHKCFTGPSLSKSKISELPRFVGPGPVLLVIEEVISKIISVAYVPSRVLNELSSKNFEDVLKKNQINKTQRVVFKAKYQKRSYRDEIVIIKSAEHVEDYCRSVCGHLKCCYNLFGTNLYDGDECPSNCRGLTKSNKVLKRAIYYREKAKAEAKEQKQSIVDKDKKMKLISSKKENESRKEVNGKSESFDALSQEDLKITESKAENKSQEIKRKSHVDSTNFNDEEKDKDDQPKKLKTNDLKTVDGIDIINEDFQNSPSIVHRIPQDEKNALHWTVNDVYNYINKSPCSMFASTLLEHEIDGPALLLLDNETIKNHLIPSYTRKYNLQHVMKFSDLIKKLRKNINGFLE